MERYLGGGSMRGQIKLFGSNDEKFNFSLDPALRELLQQPTIILEKGEMQIHIPTEYIFVFNKQRSYHTLFFAGIIPPRKKKYGKKEVYLPQENCLGFAEWSKKEHRFIQDSIRIVRVGKELTEKQRYKLLKILHIFEKWIKPKEERA